LTYTIYGVSVVSKTEISWIRVGAEYFRGEINAKKYMGSSMDLYALCLCIIHWRYYRNKNGGNSC